MAFTSETKTTIRLNEVFDLVAGDKISVLKNGTEVASYEVPAGKKARIIMTANGTEV